MVKVQEWANSQYFSLQAQVENLSTEEGRLDEQIRLSCCSLVDASDLLTFYYFLKLYAFGNLCIVLRLLFVQRNAGKIEQSQ